MPFNFERKSLIRPPTGGSLTRTQPNPDTGPLSIHPGNRYEATHFVDGSKGDGDGGYQNKEVFFGYRLYHIEHKDIDLVFENKSYFKINP